MGLREAVGVAMFAVALAITISLTFNDDGFADGSEPRPISTGLTPPTLTPEATATATAVPVIALGDPDVTWIISYFRHGADGEPSLETSIGSDLIELTFEHAPFPDMQDDQWSVTAEATFERAAGRYGFSVETSGHMDVQVNGAVVRSTGELTQPEVVEVVFDHPGGRLDVAVLAADRGGPFRLVRIPD